MTFGSRVYFYVRYGKYALKREHINIRYEPTFDTLFVITF